MNNDIDRDFDSGGGTNFARPFGVAPFSNPVADVAGYRLLSVPVTGTTVGTLAGINLVQGIPAGSGNVQQQYPDASANLYTTYGPTGYAKPADTGTVIPPGKGFFWLWYDQAIVPDPASFGGGTSTSRELSDFRLDAATNFQNASVSQLGGFTYNGTQAANGNPAVSGFYMIGNPFPYPVQADGIQPNLQARQSILQTWEPSGRNAGTYRPIEGTQALARWQGAFAEISAPNGFAPDFNFDVLRTTAQNVQGRTGSGPQGGFYRAADATSIAFTLSGVTSSGAETRDEAAIVRLLPDALDGWDARDASKLTPPAGAYALLSPVTARDGAATRTAVTSLPTDGQARTVPLAFLATDAGAYTLAWDATLASGTGASLRDLATGVVTDLEAQDHYAFTSGAADWTERFELVLSPRGATATEEAAGTDGLRVLAPRPNPARGTSEVAVELGAPQHVRADLFDALGRRVARVYDAAAPAGALALRLDVSGLAPGVYVLRVSGDTATATRTVTVAR